MKNKIKIGIKKKIALHTLVLFVTYKCNSKCKTCFYWRQLNNKNEELSLSEISKISFKLGNINHLLISGGEPTLRKDLADIIKMFYKNNHINELSLPTNCMQPKKTTDLINDILKGCPNMIFNIGLSLDGTKNVHNNIRRVNCFDRVIEFERRLRNIKNKNLNVKVLTTITSDNYDNLPVLMKFVRDNMEARIHYFEPLRGNLKENNQQINYNQLKRINRLILINLKYYYNNKLKLAYDLYNIRRSQRNAESFFKDGKMILKCNAGGTTGVIDPNGDVRLCELLEPIGNIRDFDYDFYKVWYSKKANEKRKVIPKCGCTHCVFIEKSFLSKVLQ